ncbi:MAG: 3-mercaptopyruvate sulfurtransferase [Symbiobacteriaceae bacterium]|jgi:thiosulfate/3-mercaptopyruvate sulfurtransferase|nr:3-mercaptopyruvate sulfurtransferase [Symbiobacteriaceae bacterium]
MTVSRPLVTVHQLVALQTEGKPLVIADCRAGSADDLEAGRRAYQTGHIPGAVYFHLEQDLSGPEGEHGGRHPLPDPAAAAAKLGAAGVGPGVTVVAYDETGAFAARCWWLLRWLGHDDVVVLDGGIKAWVGAGLPLTTELPAPAPRVFTPNVRPAMVAAMEEVRNRPAEQVVVDARSAARFAGAPDPLDAKQGHVPGAVNRFWGDNLNPDGTWKSPAELAERFAGLPGPERLIHHCGSGVTACANLLAMAAAGLEHGRLYVGSWSDWCTWDENPVEQ